MASDEINFLILAAGSSSRLGQSKQLLIVEGEPLLVRTVKTALLTNIGKVYVILGANHQAHHEIIRDLPVTIVNNPSWEKGMGSSIKAGLTHLISTSPQTTAVNILVCDQPFLHVNHLKEMTDRFHQGSGIVASEYSGTLGVPALFSKDYFNSLLALPDSEGARKIIKNYAEKVASIPFPEGAIDLDTPTDVAGLGDL